ncbi:NnrS protein [compost metagenome]
MTSGAAALAIFTIMALAGRIHAGLWLDRRPWLPLCAMLLVTASLLRALAGMPLAANAAMVILSLSGLLWAFCFATFLYYTWTTFSGPREDGLEDCSEPQARNGGGC